MSRGWSSEHSSGSGCTRQAVRLNGNHLQDLHRGLLFKQVRGEDIPCRYGGDEFIVILPDASLDVTRERAEQLSNTAKASHFQFEGQVLEPVSLSLGVAVFPEHGVPSKAILRAVDATRYRAKHEGRSRVIMADRLILLFFVSPKWRREILPRRRMRPGSLCCRMSV